jgi:preprotein translocase subunit SecF
MKRIFRFSKYFLFTVILSSFLMVAGIVGYVVKGGFNLGVDFQAGLIQEIQFAPVAMELTYTGKGIASISMDKNKLDLVVSGSDVEKATFSFPFAAYPTVGSIVDGLSAIEGMTVSKIADSAALSTNLIQSAQGNPRLGSVAYSVHQLIPSAVPIPIDTVRKALSPVENSSVQLLGRDTERKFLLRVEDKGQEDGFAKTATEKLSDALDAAFGPGEFAIARTDYVGARFSKHLTDQVGLLVFLTLFVILIYASIRFKPQYAIGAVLAIAHDALIMVAFIVWTRMEFNTTTIAAILTILGYSINDTIVIFDRIRETVRLYPDDSFVQNMDRAITETLGRTFITTITTMLAVSSLFIFTTGSMKDFALALLVGMVSGVYSTIFIASAFVNTWNNRVKKQPSKKVAAQKVGELNKA